MHSNWPVASRANWTRLGADHQPADSRRRVTASELERFDLAVGGRDHPTTGMVHADLESLQSSLHPSLPITGRPVRESGPVAGCKIPPSGGRRTRRRPRSTDWPQHGFAPATEMPMTRRSFIAASLATAAACRPAKARTTQLDPDGFFTLDRRKDHWWLITPAGEPFFSLGLNHIDPASLRYPENIHLWRERYGGSTTRWIRESVVPKLKRWGFNSVGWVQEITVRRWRHSRPFTNDEYRALDMPFCHLLPFTESHQWEKHTRHFDFLSKQWEEWADYVARSHCAELADDRNLIGYFYSDCPTWIHYRNDNAWRGPIFDPERLKTESGRKELADLATRYYKTTHDAIRRHDPHHLIFGDRYEANAPVAMEVVESAGPFVDVLSFQDFRDPVAHLADWHSKTGKPVLLADGAGNARPMTPDGFRPNDGEWYARMLTGSLENPGCVGFHLCGAFQRNKARRRGLLDELERPDQGNVERITAANHDALRWMNERLR